MSDDAPPLSQEFLRSLRAVYRRITEIEPLTPSATPLQITEFQETITEATQWIGQMSDHLHGVNAASTEGIAEEVLLGRHQWGKFFI
jgi:hypothetical protein